MSWHSLLHDPGPCPVCDAPHHTCVGDSGTAIVVPLRRLARAPAPAPPVDPAPVTFTTVSYPQVKAAATRRTKA